MRKSWLLCVLLGTLAVGQAQQTPPAMPAEQNSSAAAQTAPQGGPQNAAPAKEKEEEKRAPAAAAPAKPAAPPEVPMDAVVLTIKGVCPATPKPAATAEAKGTEKKTPDKTTAAKKPECETKITRAQFEKIANGLAPNVTPQLKRQLETALPKFMAMSEIAKKKGLDKTPQYLETVKFLRMQILSQQLQRVTQEQADKVPPQEIEDYYKKNPEAYEQFSLDRLFIPRYKQVLPEKEGKDEKEPEKMTEEQQKEKEAADKARQEAGEKELDALADKLRERAAAGEDFVTLQKEAFAAAGNKVENPTVNLPKVRRTGLPPAHSAVFDLKAGEVSVVISDNGGHYIYKVVSKEVLPLDQVKDEIHNKLKNERLKEAMEKYTNSYQVTSNEAYFGPAQPPPSPRRRMPPPGAPPAARPQGATPPPANTPAKPEAAAPAKPN